MFQEEPETRQQVWTSNPEQGFPRKKDLRLFSNYRGKHLLLQEVGGGTAESGGTDPLFSPARACSRSTWSFGFGDLAFIIYLCPLSTWGVFWEHGITTVWSLHRQSRLWNQQRLGHERVLNEFCSWRLWSKFFQQPGEGRGGLLKVFSWILWGKAFSGFLTNCNMKPLSKTPSTSPYWRHTLRDKCTLDLNCLSQTWKELEQHRMTRTAKPQPNMAGPGPPRPGPEKL